MTFCALVHSFTVVRGAPAGLRPTATIAEAPVPIEEAAMCAIGKFATSVQLTPSNSSVLTDVPPPINKPSAVVPAPPPAYLAVPTSPTSVQEVPFHSSTTVLGAGFPDIISIAV